MEPCILTASYQLTKQRQETLQGTGQLQETGQQLQETEKQLPESQEVIDISASPLVITLSMETVATALKPITMAMANAVSKGPGLSRVGVGGV